jgi:hypothetical protein
MMEGYKNLRGKATNAKFCVGRGSLKLHDRETCGSTTELLHDDTLYHMQFQLL